MKAIPAFLFAIPLLSFFAIVKVFAQTVAIGHITAEVVESVSTSSLAITGFDMKYESSVSTLALTECAGWNNENLNLGDFKINSGAGISCNVVIKPVSLSDGDGNGFTIEPFAAGSFQNGIQAAVGNQTLHLRGRGKMPRSQAAGLYKGSYTMVFAYN